ncbi:hypothetical protein E1200_16210 [Actinomadura sp. GC306]|uniref:IPT/TIG domain-containing protein n=1 Tax=Actinomadura sp. GC306 TaxID=2530367 RepID=UPI0010511F1B|nr:IPT/TIG domain-containing protein [Actinomadura sp. GC306]TDC66720.1 hypothetical protein E1200_16210 [Actinomadura sp. GC306]
MAESPVGSGYASTRDIVLAAILLLAGTALLVVVLVQAWPPAPVVGPDGRTEPPAGTTTVELPGWSPTLSRETSMFVIVMAAGALGAVVHVLRSFYWYVGNRALRRSWLMMYLLLPFVGALLGLVVYLVLRGGLTSPTGGASDINPYGITAIAALVGLFSQETSEKLRSVFGTLLAQAPAGRDQVGAPRITAVEPDGGPVGTVVALRGTGLGSATAVRFGAAQSRITHAADTLIRTAVPPGATTAPPVVLTPAGPVAAPAVFTVE